MPRDIEDLLRESLAARAQDVTPDPETFSRVQRRIRRGRIWRLSAAGGVVVATLALLAVVVPTLRSQRVEFTPAPPVASQPAEPSEEPGVPAGEAGGLLFTEGAAAYVMALDGESATQVFRAGEPGCEPKGCDAPFAALAARPGSTTSDLTFVVRPDAECPNLELAVAVVEDGTVTNPAGGPIAPADQMCSTSATFASDGAWLAWTAPGSEGNAWMLHTVDWSDGGWGEEDASFGVELPTSRMTIDEWVWTASSGATKQGWVYLVADDTNGARVFRMAVEQQADGAVAIPSGELEPLPSDDDFVPVAYAEGAAGYTVDVRWDDEGVVADARLTRREEDGVLATVDLPAEWLSVGDVDAFDFWISAVGDTIMYGDGRGAASWTTWGGAAFTAPRQIAAEIVAADLLAESQESPPTPDEPATAAVDLYFGGQESRCLSDVTVTREVQTPAVARGALNALLAGPNPQEQNEGLTSPFSAATADALLDVTIDEGVATVDLMHLGEWIESDPCTGDLVHSAIERTLLQFSTVEQVRITFDGNAQLYRDWKDSGGPAGPAVEGPPAAVIDTAERIRTAAAAGDYEALDALIDPEQFTCTFGDPSTPCVEQWQAQEKEGLDPLGVLVEILGQGPAQVEGAPIWTYPAAHATDPEYLGPRTGIDEDGIWRYYQQGGD